MKSSDNEDTPKEIPNKAAKSNAPSCCNYYVHPQQNEFEFEDFILDSKIDSGNLWKASRFADCHVYLNHFVHLKYHLWIAPDCCGTAKETGNRTWFYFKIRNIKKYASFTFTIKNMNAQAKLYNEGLMPVFKSYPSSPVWNSIKQQSVGIAKGEAGMELTFRHILESDDQEVHLAWVQPWSYKDDQDMLADYQEKTKLDKDIYFKRELLVLSREERRVELLTITSQSGKLEKREKVLPGLFPQVTPTSRPCVFDKKYVVVSARVHPGEVPASHMLNGLLKLLFDKNDPRAKALRDNFVFVIIPMLNPDGVYRGHFRADTQGLNLNRFYHSPTLAEHPTVFAAKSVVVDLAHHGRLYLYVDLHAHATKKGCFVFGNNLDFRQQVESRMFPKLLSVNSEYFEYSSCSFSEKNLVASSKGDTTDKEGAGRVALWKATGLVNCYTLEANYAAGKYRNVLIEPKSVNPGMEEEKIEPTILENVSHKIVESNQPYNVDGFGQLGEGIGVTLLDMVDKNPCSRIPNSPYKNVTNVKLNIALSLMKEPPFRFDNYFRKISKNITQEFENFKAFLEKNPKKEAAMEKAAAAAAPKDKAVEKIGFKETDVLEMVPALVQEKPEKPKIPEVPEKEQHHHHSKKKPDTALNVGKQRGFLPELKLKGSRQVVGEVKVLSSKTRSLNVSFPDMSPRPVVQTAKRAIPMPAKIQLPRNMRPRRSSHYPIRNA